MEITLKKNCRWVTKKENLRNKRNNHLVKYKNKLITIAELSERVGVPQQIILGRLKTGWTLLESIDKNKYNKMSKIIGRY